MLSNVSQLLSVKALFSISKNVFLRLLTNMNKKISFGFTKTTKKNDIVSKPPKVEKSVELIDCLEGQSIKIKNAKDEVEKPLIIPMNDSKKNLLDRVKDAAEKRKQHDTKQEVEEPPDSALSIDELAARELIRDAQNREESKTTTTKVHLLPQAEDKFVAEGEAEPSLEDYENVPITDYGMAMLRGMGWSDGMPIGKNTSRTTLPTLPELRPKGLGLGANKMVNAEKPKTSVDKDGKELILVKGAFAKIIAGSHKGNYCQVEGLDDENCRIIVKTANSNNVLSLNEFLVVPVTKEEYLLGSKVINNAKYEEYKDKCKLSRSYKKEKHSSSGSDDSVKHKKKSKHKRSRSRSRESRKHKKHSRDRSPHRRSRSKHN